jgi:8-oxo-dGTP pyrophosphatase MutT (NUDIX family)
VSTCSLTALTSWHATETSPPTPAAVLVPLFRDEEGVLRLVLVVRGALGRHAHQLSLPGGKHEPADASFLETALRETEEEIGLAREEVEVIAALPAIDTRATGFRVHPYLTLLAWRLLRQGRFGGACSARVVEVELPQLLELGFDHRVCLSRADADRLVHDLESAEPVQSP